MWGNTNGHHGHSYARHSSGKSWLWMAIGIVAGFFVLSFLFRSGIAFWLLFLFFVMPMTFKLIHRFNGGRDNRRARGFEGYKESMKRNWDSYAEGEKPKRYTPNSGYRMETDADSDEKPKNRPTYVVGDDGELVEFKDDPRKPKNDHIDYV
jgi:hypothetical protein